MSANFFRFAIASALALPLSQSILLASATCAGDQAQMNIQMQVPVAIPGWQHAQDPTQDCEEGDCFQRSYRNKDGQTLFLLVRQTSAYRFHDFLDCFKALGREPEAIANTDIAVDGGRKSIHASVVRTSTDGGVPQFGVNWFQNGEQTTGSQRGWKLLLVKNGMRLNPPLCRQAYMTVRNCPESSMISLLNEAAPFIYHHLQ